MMSIKLEMFEGKYKVTFDGKIIEFLKNFEFDMKKAEMKMLYSSDNGIVQITIPFKMKEKEVG